MTYEYKRRLTGRLRSALLGVLAGYMIGHFRRSMGRGCSQ